MNSYLQYSLVLLAYLPGMVALFCWKKIWFFPMLVMGFLGMFFFNAVGSFGVINLSSLYWVHFDRAAVVSEYCTLLVSQVMIYYLIIGTYIGRRSPPSQVNLVVARFDNHFIVAGVLLILIISATYFFQTGAFLLSFALDGTLNTENAYEYRMKYVYGVKNWPIFNLGFVMLPTFIASYVVIRAKLLKKLDFLFYFSLTVCFVASMSLGSKGGLLGFVLSLGIAYIVCLCSLGSSPWRVFRNRTFMVFSFLSSLLLVFGYFQATSESMTWLNFFEKLWYRLFVTSTETIAAAISYANEVGVLGMRVFPTARGLLDHKQENLPLLLHEYIALMPGGVNLPVAAEAFLVNGWWSVIVILPIVFLTLIALQEIAFRLRLGIFSIAFSAYYGYLILLLSVLGMFGTLFTFMYASVLILLSLVALASMYCLKIKR